MKTNKCKKEAKKISVKSSSLSRAEEKRKLYMKRKLRLEQPKIKLRVLIFQILIKEVSDKHWIGNYNDWNSQILN